MTIQPSSRTTEIPRELDRWNWGAFLLSWIWGIGNSTFVALLALIPGVNIVMMFVLGARGSRWAWRNRLWRDAEQFRRTQRNWAIAGLVVWVASIGGCSAIIGSVPLVIKNSEPYRVSMQSLRGDQRVVDALGEDFSAKFWIGGSLNVDADGTGQASLSIPVKGSKGSGTAIAQAKRFAGTWDIRLLLVQIDGSDAPIVLVNKDKLSVPGASIGI